MRISATTGLFYRDLGAWWLHDDRDSRWRPSIEKNDRKRGWRISAGRAPQYLSGLERAGNAVFSATPNMARQFLYQQLVHIRDLNPVQPLAGMTVSAPCRATKQAARLADVRTWKPSEPIKPLAIMSFTSASEQCLTSASEQSATESPLKDMGPRGSRFRNRLAAPRIGGNPRRLCERDDSGWFSRTSPGGNALGKRSRIGRCRCLDE